MIVKKEAMTLEVSEEDWCLVATKGKPYTGGLMRIFRQFVLEEFGDMHVPVGTYQVTRTKWPFRRAVFKVETLA